jgi:hypothetical protein
VNADRAAGFEEGLIPRAAGRVQQAGTASRAFYVATSALSGAVLYLLATWPSHAVAPRALAVAGPPVNPPSPQAEAVIAATAATAPTAGDIASVSMLEAVRAVGGVSSSVLLAQRGERPGDRPPLPATSAAPAPALPIVAAAASPGPANAAAVSLAASAPGASPSRSTAGAANIGASVDTRQPPAGSDGPNRIAIPGAVVSPPVTGTTLPLPPAGSSNRIGVPPTQPPR